MKRVLLRRSAVALFLTLALYSITTFSHWEHGGRQMSHPELNAM
jgi:hypothetical protein